MPSDTRRRFAQIAALPPGRSELVEAALLIAEEAGAAADRVACLGELDALAEEARPMLAEAHTPAERAAALSRFLCEVKGFRGNQADYYDPRNSFLGEVLARRTGIPITLALVYLEVGRRLGLRLEGVNFPGHFLVKVCEAGQEVLIDPFSGQLLSRPECAALLQDMSRGKARFDPLLLQAAPVPLILRRMLTNLKLLFLQQRQEARALACSDLILLLAPDDPAEVRDRGLLYHRLECYPEAQADLERYLALAPTDAGADAIRPFLEEARKRARLN